jgi:hypothetical protein
MMRKKSDLWYHFSSSEPGKGKCRYCSFVISCTERSTGNLTLQSTRRENIQLYLYIGLQHQLKQVSQDPSKMSGPNRILQQRKLLLQLCMRTSHLLALQGPFRQDSLICHRMSTYLSQFLFKKISNWIISWSA